MQYNFYCPRCGEQLSAEVNLGEHIVDWDEICFECNYKFNDFEINKIYNDAIQDCLGARIDYAMDMLKDR